MICYQVIFDTQNLINQSGDLKDEGIYTYNSSISFSMILISSCLQRLQYNHYLKSWQVTMFYSFGMSSRHGCLLLECTSQEAEVMIDQSFYHCKTIIK